jgi:hypothetical protein
MKNMKVFVGELIYDVVTITSAEDPAQKVNFKFLINLQQKEPVVMSHSNISP